MLLCQADSALAREHIQRLRHGVADIRRRDSRIRSTGGHSGLGARHVFAVGVGLCLGRLLDVVRTVDLVFIQHADGGFRKYIAKGDNAYG